MPENKNYSTSDIQVAATLIAMGHELVDTTRSQRQLGMSAKAVFHFNDSEDLRKHLFGYTNNTLKVSPRDLFARFKELKSFVHNLLQ